MSETMKDSAIKLFGKTISLLPDDVVSDVSVSEQRHSSFATSTSPDHKESTDPARETLTEASTTSDVDDEANTPETPKKEESNDSNTLKKPDKILPCPRCKSMDTKFCYYNNYNVNQPRHFCKNCQRYWTSGGTMRNVPVGSGRRKIKNPNPKPHHMMISNPLQPGFLIGPDSGFPVSFYPATTYWTAPLVASSLGKHSREENMVGTSQDIRVWNPKTLRVHDPSEAAKSSIWATLGRIESGKTGLFNGSGFFKAFESRGDRKFDSTTIVRQANPAALSRSLDLYERA